jgi:hypothetical protein
MCVDATHGQNHAAGKDESFPDTSVPASDRRDRVLVVGPIAAPEFAELAGELLNAATGCALTLLPRLDPGPVEVPPTDLVVVLERSPDEYPAEQVSWLMSQLPLARILVCSEPWCQSAGRTRDVWPPGMCVPAWQGARRFREELAAMRHGAGPPPRSIDRNEAYELEFAPASTESAKLAGPALRVLVDSPDPAVRDWLCAALSAVGHTVLTLPDEAADVVLMDVDPWSPTQAAELEHLRRRARGAPLVALAGFPTAELRASVSHAGASAVLDKLTPLGPLCDGLVSSVRDDVAFPRIGSPPTLGGRSCEPVCTRKE